MRIIAGSLKGRKLNSPKTDDVRPTTDKVREAVFDILYNYFNPGFTAFDVFAGSGAMGLEAISRGASKVFFSDNNRDSLALTRTNAQVCGVLEQCVLLNGDFKRNIARIKEPVDLYFLDPPYADGYILPALKAIDEADVINPDGIVCCEHSSKEKLPEKIYGFTQVRQRRYGTIGVTVYQRGDREIGV